MMQLRDLKMGEGRAFIRVLEGCARVLYYSFLMGVVKFMGFQRFLQGFLMVCLEFNTGAFML